MRTMACARIAILAIEFVVVALVQTATAHEEQHTSLPHGPLKLVDPKTDYRGVTNRKLSGSRQSDKALKAGLPHRIGDVLGISNIAHDDQKFCAGRGRDGDGAETEQPL